MQNAKLIAGCSLETTSMGLLSDTLSIDFWCRVSGDAKVRVSCPYRFMDIVHLYGSLILGGLCGSSRMAKLTSTPGTILGRLIHHVVHSTGQVQMAVLRCWTRMAIVFGTRDPSGSPMEVKMSLNRTHPLKKTCMGQSS